MSEVVRLSLSLDANIYEKLQRLVEQSGYSNRSEYIRDLIREQLVENEWNEEQQVVGTIMLIYNHHKRMLSETLTELQHNYHEDILASTHVHLDHEVCAEVIIAKALPGRIKSLADELRQQVGVLHAELSIGTTGRDLLAGKTVYE